MNSTEPPTFLALIDRLTIDTTEWVERDHGRTLHTREGLLPQLRGAVFGGMETGGSGSAFGSKPPIDASAVDLLDEITVQATEALASVDNRPTPYGTAEHYVRLWAGQTRELSMLTVTAKRTSTSEPPTVYRHRLEVSAYQLASSWVDRVEDFFNPPSTREIAAPCPACETRYVFKERDGQTVQSAALSFVRNTEGRTTGARCAACGVAWLPAQFEWLAHNVGAKPLPEMANDTP